MKNLNLKVYGLTSLQNVDVQINGKTISCARNEFDAFETNFQTEDEVVEVRVVRNLELAGKFWWLFAFLTYVISFSAYFKRATKKTATCSTAYGRCTCSPIPPLLCGLIRRQSARRLQCRQMSR